MIKSSTRWDVKHLSSSNKSSFIPLSHFVEQNHQLIEPLLRSVVGVVNTVRFFCDFGSVKPGNSSFQENSDLAIKSASGGGIGGPS